MEQKQGRLNGELIQKTHDYLLVLGRLAVNLAGVERQPRYPDGNRENDAEHSFHLALSATELSVALDLKLDVGLVSQFSTIHDLPEVYARDVWTFNITEEDLSNKKASEKLATNRLMEELPPHTAHLLDRYEKQIEPEARFVRFIDKLLPAIIDIMAGSANTFQDDYGIKNIEGLMAKRVTHLEKLKEMFPEFSEFESLVTSIWDTSAKNVFKETK